MMKRGLSSTDAAHPAAVYAGRVQRVRDIVRGRGLDAGICYGDASAGGDIAYLTHAMLYWADGALIVPAAGPVALVKTLGPRTDTWFRGTCYVDELHSGPVLAPLLTRVLGGRGYRTLGLFGADGFPAAVIDALTSERARLTDLGQALTAARSKPDAVSAADLGQAAALGHAALACARARLADGYPDAARAEAEFTMRTGGAWDATVRATLVDGQTAVIDLRCQVRDAWFSAQRTFREGRLVEDEAFGAVCAAIKPGIGASELRSALPGGAGTTQDELLVRPMPALESAPCSGPVPSWLAEAGTAAHVGVRRWDASRLRAAHGDTVMITADGARAVLPGASGEREGR